MMATQHNGLRLQVPVASDRAGTPPKQKRRKRECWRFGRVSSGHAHSDSFRALARLIGYQNARRDSTFTHAWASGSGMCAASFHIKSSSVYPQQSTAIPYKLHFLRSDLR